MAHFGSQVAMIWETGVGAELLASKQLPKESDFGSFFFFFSVKLVIYFPQCGFKDFEADL